MEHTLSKSFKAKASRLTLPILSVNSPRVARIRVRATGVGNVRSKTRKKACVWKGGFEATSLVNAGPGGGKGVAGREKEPSEESCSEGFDDELSTMERDNARVFGGSKLPVPVEVANEEVEENNRTDDTLGRYR